MTDSRTKEDEVYLMFGEYNMTWGCLEGYRHIGNTARIKKVIRLAEIVEVWIDGLHVFCKPQKGDLLNRLCPTDGDVDYNFYAWTFDGTTMKILGQVEQPDGL